MIGDIIKGTTEISLYQPPQDVLDFSNMVLENYQQGWANLTKPWEELNGYSIIDRMNKDQRTFNAWVDESTESAEEAWKYRGTRSLAATKAMAMHAHMTSRYAIANVSAQNEEQESDRMAGNIMKDITEWMTVNSNYRESILLATMGILVNPLTWLEGEFHEINQIVRDSKGKETTMLDEVFSGFQVDVLSSTQVLVGNMYEKNVQRQPFIIKRRWLDYATAYAKYHEHENWNYVQTGYKSVYSEKEGIFYDIKDDEHPSLVSEEIILIRVEDTEVPYVGGIYMGNDNVKANPIRHRDNRNAPKYNVVPFGYHKINEHFLPFKSLMNITGWDNHLLDSLWRIGMDHAILATLMPTAVSGVEKFDTQIIFPGSVTAFQNPDARVTPLLPNANQNPIFNAISKVEDSLQEKSLSETLSGDLPAASQKAFTVGKAEQHSQTLLKGALSNFAISLTQFFPIMVDIAIQHLTVAEVDEITEATRYRRFILEDQVVSGKKVSKNIIFDESMQGRSMTKQEEDQKSLELLKETGFPENDTHLYLVNPHLFSKLKYLVRYDPDLMNEKNEGFERAMATNLYTMLRADPLIEPTKLVRKLLNTFYRGESDDLMAKTQINQIMNQKGIKPKQSQMGAQAEQREIGLAVSA